MAEKKQQMFIIGVVAFIAIIYFATMQTATPRETMEPVDWQKEYIDSARIGLLNYDEYTQDTEYYQLDNPTIIIIADEIKLRSRTPKEAVDNTLQWVYNNVEYKVNEPDELCFDGTAPSIIQSRSGQCDTQSIVVIALLREMRIASKQVAGCVLVKPECKYQAIFIDQPKTLLVPEVTLDPDAESFSRSGGLHAWAEVWIDGHWVQLEPTLGKEADIGCYDYHVELFPTDDQKELFCTSQSYTYAKACQSSNIEILNQNGEGLITSIVR